MPITNYLAGLFRPTITKADPEPDEPAPISLTDPLAAWIFGAQPTYSNVAVTPKTAMEVPAVSSAVEVITKAVGTLPAKLFVRNAEGKEADPAHPAFRLIHDEANDWTSAAELRTQLTHDALLYDKGGFALANRVDGRVIEFNRLDPANVEPKTDEATGEPFYLVRQGRKNVRHDYQDMLHIQAFGGTAPINRARNAIGLAIDLERHAARLFARGARPSGILRHPSKLSETTAQRLKEGWQASQAGDSSGGTALLEDGMEFQALTFNSVDSQFIEQRRYQVEEIARAFRVPPTMLFDLTRGTWSNTEEMGQQFLTLTLRPWLTTFVDISNELLADSGGAAEAEVRLALAEDFGQKEAIGFMKGTGSGQPEGLMTHEAIDHVVNGHAANLSTDKLIDLLYSFPSAYRNAPGFRWAMNGTTLAAVRKLKNTTTGEYIWQPALVAGQPETLLGKPVLELVDIDDIGDGKFPIIAGDFSAYRIVDRLALSILSDPFTQARKGVTRLHATRRTGGRVLQAERFRKLKTSAS